MEDASFKEVFETEIEGWCHGLSMYPGEIHQALIHRTIRELAPSFADALHHGIEFDIISVAKKFSRAARSLVTTKEIAFAILFHLPNPKQLSEDEQNRVARIVDRMEQQYGGALLPMQQRWNWTFSQLTPEAQKVA